MNNLIRRSAAPAIGCLFTSSFYETYNKHPIEVKSKHNYVSHNSSSSASHVVRCDANANIHVNNKSLGVNKVDEGPLLTVGNTSKDGSNENEQKDTVTPLEETKKEHNLEDEVKEDDQGPFFHDLFPLRQLMKPDLEYPLWDENWDGRQMDGEDGKDKKVQRYIRKHGVTRHIILIRQ